MMGDETRRLLQEAHSIRRYESPAPLGGLLAISLARVRDLDAPQPAGTMALGVPPQGPRSPATTFPHSHNRIPTAASNL
jgi:hypothetical protein